MRTIERVKPPCGHYFCTRIRMVMDKFGVLGPKQVIALRSIAVRCTSWLRQLSETAS